MVPWGAQLLPAVIFQALSASATAKVGKSVLSSSSPISPRGMEQTALRGLQVGCHSECKKPHCVEGAAWNGSGLRYRQKETMS